jgi:hypothetical protein
MKAIVGITALMLGLSQLAFANHHDGEDGGCKKMMQEKSGMLDMDLNKDGAVSHDEYTAASLERAEKTFEHIDANNDGKLDDEEQHIAKEIWASRYKKHHAQVYNDPHHGMNMPDDEYHQMPNDPHHNMNMPDDKNHQMPDDAHHRN